MFIYLVIIIGLLALLGCFWQKKTANFPPGPNGIPVLGYAPFLRLPVQKCFAELSKKYGKMFGILLGNYPIIVLSDWKIVRDAYEDERMSCRPELKIFEQMTFGRQRGIILGNGNAWKEQHRFTVKHLREFGFGKGSMEELIKDELLDLTREFRKTLHRPVSIHMPIIVTLLNVLWFIVSGERYSHDDPKIKKLIQIIVEEAERPGIEGALFFMPWFTKLFPKLSGLESFLDTMKRTTDFLSETVTAHKRTLDKNNPRDFIDVYLMEIEKTTDQNSSFWKEEGEKELLSVLQDLFMAGVETVSSFVDWVILYLITYPNIQEKVWKEIDSIVGTNRLPSLSDRHRMPYLEAVLAETMRMCTFTPIGPPHAVTETMKFHGYTLPKGTIVLTNFWQLHNDKDYWGDPETFRPERFINETGSFQKDEGLNPFSVGKRTCIGECLTRDTTFLFVAILLQQFSFEMDQNSPPPSLESKISMITLTRPYNVIIRERERWNYN